MFHIKQILRYFFTTKANSYTQSHNLSVSYNERQLNTAAFTDKIPKNNTLQYNV